MVCGHSNNKVCCLLLGDYLQCNIADSKNVPKIVNGKRVGNRSLWEFGCEIEMVSKICFVHIVPNVTDNDDLQRQHVLIATVHINSKLSVDPLLLTK